MQGVGLNRINNLFSTQIPDDKRSNTEHESANDWYKKNAQQIDAHPSADAEP